MLRSLWNSTKRVTGIPKHVVLFESQRSLVLQHREMIDSNERIPEVIQNSIETS